MTDIQVNKTDTYKHLSNVKNCLYSVLHNSDVTIYVPNNETDRINK